MTTQIWVQDFLRGSGGNIGLADKLREYEDFVVGPIDYPLEGIVNIIGPTKKYKYFEEASVLEARVDRMIESINDGWNPEPLILTNIWENHLELADGGHRQRALFQVGYKTYPTIIYFRDESTKRQFINTMSA